MQQHLHGLRFPPYNYADLGLHGGVTYQFKVAVSVKLKCALTIVNEFFASVMVFVDALSAKKNAHKSRSHSLSSLHSDGAEGILLMPLQFSTSVVLLQISPCPVLMGHIME